MKLSVRIFLIVLCAFLIISMPFVISAPLILPEAEGIWKDDTEDDEGGETLDFGRCFFSTAAAEEAAGDHVITEEINPEELINPASLDIPDAWVLPFDFSIPPEPDPDHYTERGYEDRSIRVHVETKEMKESTVHIAYIEIASASQLRTATYKGVGSFMTNLLQPIAIPNHAVIAMNGDLFAELPEKKSFEIRMMQLVTYKGKRNRTNNLKDILVIDVNGDFHLFIKSKGLKDYYKENKDEIVNAFTFGPALVVDGEIPNLDTNYAYNPNGRTARSAIGQTGHLSYVFVVVEARGKTGKGVSHEQLAEIMQEIGCQQAYNLDGGNTAEMILLGPDPDNPLIHVKGDQQAAYRSHSDIIYFATAVPENERQ